MRKILSYAIPILLILGMAFIAYSAVFPLHVAKPIKQPWTVETKQIVPGGVLKYEAALCKYTDSEGTITRQLFGTESKFINSEPSNIPEGCSTGVRAVTLPDDTAIGKYKMLITVEYRVNTFNTDTVRFETEEFEVVSPNSPTAPKPNTPGGIFSKAPTTNDKLEPAPSTTPAVNAPPSVIMPPLNAPLNLPINLPVNTGSNVSVPSFPILPICILKICL
jgi:hypothetical protein